MLVIPIVLRRMMYYAYVPMYQPYLELQCYCVQNIPLFWLPVVIVVTLTFIYFFSWRRGYSLAFASDVATQSMSLTQYAAMYNVPSCISVM